MGRPPLNLKPVPVRFAPEVLARIDAIAGTYGRPAFIREAVAEKLAREAQGGTETEQTDVART
jgi:hypothetical protein